MPFVVWPATLPQKLPVSPESPMQELRADGREGWQPDAGPPQYVRVFTAEPITYRCPPMVISEEQRLDLIDFWDTALHGGADPFTWTDPWEGSSVVYTFKLLEKPTFEWFSPRIGVQSAYRAGGAATQRLHRVSLVLLQLPWYP